MTTSAPRRSSTCGRKRVAERRAPRRSSCSSSSSPRSAARRSLMPAPRRPRRRSSASTPGSSLPSISSSEAPPPVESQSTSSASPNCDERGAGVAAADDRGRLGARRPPRRRPGCRRRTARARRRPSARSRRPSRRRRSPPRRRAAVRGPMSRPIMPVGHVDAVELDAARRRRRSSRRARGRSAGAARSRSPRPARAPRAASSMPSSSTSESPVSWPWARKKLKHIAPPIRISSAISRKRSMTPILSVTLAPPRTTTSGRVGVVEDRGQLAHLALEQQAGVGGQVVGDALGRGVGAVGGAEGVVDVDVGERRRAPRRARRRSLVSPGSKRVFSSSRTSPGLEPRRPRPRPRRRRRRARARPRLRAARRAARRPAPSRAPDRAPSGRPRCEQRTTAAPRSRSSSIVGSAARIRVSSATAPPSSGTLRSARTRTVRPVDVGVADRRLREAPSSPGSAHAPPAG